MATPVLLLTHEQKALLDWIVDPVHIEAHSHAILEARAGSGKTTTLLSAAQRIIEHFPSQRVLVVAFNKRIMEEITQKAARMGLRRPRFNVQTLHACGNAARMTLSEYRQSSLVQYKIADLVGEHINTLRRASAGGNLVGIGINTPITRTDLPPALDPVFVERNKMVIESLVDYGRLYGVGIAFQLEDQHVWETIIQRHITLPRSYTATSSRVTLVPDLLYHACEMIKQCESIASAQHDFIDMLWLPILSGAAFKQYDWVLIDEAQDTNELSRAISMASLAPGGRMVVVGDPHQCINGFQGADDSGIDVMRESLNASTFPLTISQRCAQSIVAHARAVTTCKDIKARSDAREGLVSKHFAKEFDYCAFALPHAAETSAILCRNNAPLVSLGFTLMRNEVPFRIAGGADLYARLVRLSSRWKVPDARSLLARLSVHRDTEVSRLRAVSAAAARIDAVTDEIDMLRTIIEEVLAATPEASQAAITQKITALQHAQETAGGKGILLSTIHKAKGLEWDTVYLYGADRLMPSQYAITAFDQQQEDHIRYVAITRARNHLIYLDFNEPFITEDGQHFRPRRP